MSNYTGMRSMPCSATGLSISIGGGAATTPKASAEGSTAGTATDADKEMASTEGMVDLVKSNPVVVLDPDNKLTPEALNGLYAAGMTMQDLVGLGFAQSDIERVEKGETVEITTEAIVRKGSKEQASTANMNTNSSGQTPSQGFPVVLIALIAAGAIALVVAAFLFMRIRKR